MRVHTDELNVPMHLDESDEGGSVRVECPDDRVECVVLCFEGGEGVEDLEDPRLAGERLGRGLDLGERGLGSSRLEVVEAAIFPW